MKRLLVMIVLLGASHLLRAQGLLDFANATTSRIFTNGFAAGLTVTNPNTYYYALLVAPTSQTTISTGPFMVNPVPDPTMNGWTFTGVIGTNTTLGRMSGNGGPGAPDGSSVAISGYAPLSVANFAVVGWSANYIGTTWAQAEQVFADPGAFWGSYIGVSSIATNVTLAPAGGPYPEIWGTGNGQIPGMTLYPIVPEPGTLALCTVGCAVVASSRRRRS